MVLGTLPFPDPVRGMQRGGLCNFHLVVVPLEIISVRILKRSHLKTLPSGLFCSSQGMRRHRADLRG